MNRDRYDREVLTELAKADGPVRTRDIIKLYRQAGVRNRRKASSRLRDLEAAGLIKDAGPWLWEYSGTQQELAA